MSGKQYFFFDVPYTETVYGTMECEIEANSLSEAREMLHRGDFTEINWEQHDSDNMHYYYSDAECTTSICAVCKEEIIYGTDCNCTDGWNDPDVYTPDQLYSTNQLGN
jgi:hypothetical protein